MQFIDVQVDRRSDGEFAVVTFGGDQGDSVVVRMRLTDEAALNRDAAVGSARAALLNAVAATEGESPLPLSNVEVDASGRAVEPPVATQSLEEEDDNAYQRPDEALPDDEEVSSIQENPTRKRGRFGDQ